MIDTVYTGKTALKQSYELFCRALVSGLCLSDAYRKAGYKAKNPDVCAIQLLKRQDIQARKAFLAKQATNDLDITIERVLKEDACIAFSDPKDLIGADGAMLPIEELPERIRRAISSVKTTTTLDGKTQTEYKLWSKGNAVDRFYKHLGMYERDNVQSTPQFLLAVGRADNAKAKQVESSIKERDMLEAVTPAEDVATSSPVTHKEGLDTLKQGDSHEGVATWEI